MPKQQQILAKDLNPFAHAKSNNIIYDTFYTNVENTSSFIEKNREITDKTTSKRKTCLHTTPDEVFLKIFSELETVDLLSVSLVNKRWHAILQDNVLWKGLCSNKKYLPVKRWLEKSPQQKFHQNIKTGELMYGYIKNKCMIPSSSLTYAPWKKVYRDCVISKKNWHVGEYQMHKISNDTHTNGHLCVSFDDSKAVSIVFGQEGSMWNMRTGENVFQLQGHQGTITTVKFDTQYIISGSVDSTIKIFNMRSKKCVSTLLGHTGQIICIQYEKSSGIIMSGSEDKTARVWRAVRVPKTDDDELGYECWKVLNGHQGAVTCLQFSGNKAVTGSVDYSIKIWNISQETCVRTLNGHHGPVYCLMYNSKHIVSGGEDAQILLWDWSKIHTSSIIHPTKSFKGHEMSIVCLQFDDFKIVSGSTDKSIKVWNIHTGKLMYNLTNHNSPIWNLKFTDTKLISSSFDSSVYVHDFGFFGDMHNE